MIGFITGPIGKMIAGLLVNFAKLFGIFKLGESRAYRKVERESRETKERMRNVKAPTSDEVKDALERGEF